MSINNIKKVAHVMSIIPSEVGERGNKLNQEDVVELIDDHQTRNLATANKTSQADALSALQNLGYTPSDSAATVARNLNENPNLSTEELIRNSLKMLSPKG